jgi:hypothetical protein
MLGNGMKKGEERLAISLTKTPTLRPGFKGKIICAM